MLEVKNVTKEFKSGDITVSAVKDISFKVDEGQFVSVIGKSGSGKSTLLSILGALEKPTSGQVMVDGEDIASMSDHKQISYRARKIGFIFQNYNLIPNLSAAENVMIPMEFAQVPISQRQTKAEKLLFEVGITAEKHKRKPGRLSGGEQQRVAIARALANTPKIILADEPTGNLDSVTGKMIFELLHKLTRTEKTTIVAVTHDLSIAGKADVAFKIKDGRIAKNKK